MCLRDWVKNLPIQLVLKLRLSQYVVITTGIPLLFDSESSIVLFIFSSQGFLVYGLKTLGYRSCAFFYTLKFSR